MVDNKKLYRQALEEVRNQYKHEIEKTLQKLIEIRDGAGTDPKEAINASKAIIVMLGVPRPAESRSTAPDAGAGFNPLDWEATPEEKARIAQILAES